MAVTLTKAQGKAIARKARQYGYFDTGRTLWVNCPECSQRVETDKFVNRSVNVQLDEAMASHLTYGDCSAHPWL